MKKIGLTGGIGSGKTYVADIFRHLGVPVFNSDEVARAIQSNDHSLIHAVAQKFPDAVADGVINRKRLAEIVFHDPEQLGKLNAIIHPAVGKAFKEFCNENANAKFVIKEAAIIFEAGLDEELDGTILVTAPEDIRIKRAVVRDKSTENEVVARMRRQWTDEIKSERADWIIRNDEERALLPQVLKIQKQILNR